MARALFIGTQSPLSAGGLAGWLASGNEVAAFWSAAPGIVPEKFGAPRLGPARLLARHGIPNVTVHRLSKWPEVVDAAAATGADVLITCATSMIVPQTLLAHFGERAVNLHRAMLPEYRGPSPYLPMLLDGRGDSDGGVTLHVLSPVIDEGDIIAQRRVPFAENGGHFTSWYAALIHASFGLTRDELPRYLHGEIAARPQTGGSYRKTGLPVIIPPSADAHSVSQMLDRAGSTMHLVVQLPGRRRPVRVVSVTRQRARTGAPPALGLLTAELDFADARLTLRRATGLERRLEKWRLARLLRPLQL